MKYPNEFDYRIKQVLIEMGEPYTYKREIGKACVMFTSEKGWFSLPISLFYGMIEKEKKIENKEQESSL